MKIVPYAFMPLALSTLFFACSEDSETAPSTYTFASRFESGASSISYSGQTQRHVQILEIKNKIADDTLMDEPDQVHETLNQLYDYSGFSSNPEPGTGAYALTLSVVDGLTLKQSTLGDIGSPASLEQKMAGNDTEFGSVAGWGDGTLSPHDAAQSMFAALEATMIAKSNGDQLLDPEGEEIGKNYVSDQGIDYQQLIQKYLTGAVAFSQGANDYLSEASLLSKDNESAVVKNDEAKSYSALEHIWDEGFGYFGAARDYGDYTDDEIAGKGGSEERQYGYFDTDGDALIDLKSEYNFGHAVNAAKRDRGSSTGVDFTTQAWNAFLAGRTLIANNPVLTDEQRTELIRYRDEIFEAWEGAIAATVVHYINDCLQDIGTFEAEPSFIDYAKHWSELKGFALSLQFNSRSPMTATQFAELHTLIGNAPVLSSAEASDIELYEQNLVVAKTLLGEVYDFDAADLGLADGTGGW